MFSAQQPEAVILYLRLVIQRRSQLPEATDKDERERAVPVAMFGGKWANFNNQLEANEQTKDNPRLVHEIRADRAIARSCISGLGESQVNKEERKKELQDQGRIISFGDFASGAPPVPV